MLTRHSLFASLGIVSVVLGSLGCSASSSDDHSDVASDEVTARAPKLSTVAPSGLGPAFGLTVTIARDGTGAPIVDASGNATVYAVHRERVDGGEQLAVMRSIDSGTTFARVGDPIERTLVNRWQNAPSIFVAPSNPDVLYLSHEQFYSWGLGTQGDEAFLLRSADGGKTWTEVSPGGEVPTASRGFATIDINPANPDHLVAANCGGVHKSTDGGRTWRVLPGSALAEGSCNHASLHRGVDDRKTMYVLHDVGEGGGSLLARSVDDGATWQVARQEVPGSYLIGVGGLTVDPRDARHVYITDMYGFYSSSDGGETFHPHNRGFSPIAEGDYARISAVAIDTVSTPPGGEANTLWIQRGEEIYRWVPANEPENGHWTFAAAVPASDWGTLLPVNAKQKPRLLLVTEGLFDDGIARGSSLLHVADIQAN